MSVELIPNWDVRFRYPTKKDIMADVWRWFRQLPYQDRERIELICTAMREPTARTDLNAP